MKRILIIILFFYILILAQTSFFIHFSQWLGFSIILISVILLNFFGNYLGFLAAFFGGFFLDIFSEGIFGINFIGFYTLILLSLAVFIKIILRRYVRISGKIS